MDPFAPSTNCPKCDKQVYQAEQVLGPARKIYHKYCFKCTNCSKRLDSNFLEHDSEPFCRPCHRSNFGTRDLRSANLSPTRTTPLDLPPSMSPAIPEDTSTQLTSPVEEDSEPSAPPLAQSQSSPPPISPFRTATSLRQQTTGTAYTGTGFSPRTTLTPNYTGNMFTKPNGSGLNTGRIANKFGSSPQCPRCGKAVYFAEQVNAIGKKWHKACLTCNACRKRLDSYTLQEHDDEPYCKQCYTRQFGTRDLRSANLSPTSSTA